MNNSLKSVFLFVIFLIPFFVFGQKNLTRQRILTSSEILPAKSKIKLISREKYIKQQNIFTIDTLSWDVSPLVNFGFFGQDWIVQWFTAPADMIIYSAGFNCAAVDNPDVPVEVKLVKMNWSQNQILSAGVQNIGYYPSNLYSGTAFEDNPDANGNWISVNGDTISGSPFSEDLWSNNGVGVKVLPIADGNCQWVQMDTLGFEPEVKAGDIIGIAIKNTSERSDSDRIGFYADNILGIPGFKYYYNGRLQTGIDFGWWSREYTFDFRLNVELFSCPPYITGTDLQSTISTEPRYVSLTFYSNGCSVLDPDSVFVVYSIDDGNSWNSIIMDQIDEINFEADIPGFPPATHIIYYYRAVNLDGYELTSAIYSYYIIKTQNENLLVFNGFSGEPYNVYPQSFYYNTDDYPYNFFSDLPYNFKGCFDVWAFGPLQSELLDAYKKVIEITTSGPNEINNDAIREWLNKSPDHDYMLIGDEWLGAQSGWANTNYSAGSFQYDILGITNDYNDINYEKDGDQDSSSIVFPVEGSIIGDNLYKLFSATGDTMLYNPSYEINVDNWLDGVSFRDDVDIFMTAYGKNDGTYNIGGARQLAAGNKIVFMAFDPLALDAPDDQYYWYGYEAASPHIQAATWMRLCDPGFVKRLEDGVPNNFELFQNYPNPFNPSTTIRYSLPVRQAGIPRQGGQAAEADAPSLVEGVHISLKVYDVLGKEVATLVNEKQKPGNYEVEFNASGFASGIYFYRLVNENFQLSKKMILLK